MSKKLFMLRAKIDKIDSKLLKLLSERLNLVNEIKKLKVKLNIPIFSKKREKIILNMCCKKAKKFGIPINFTKDIFYRILNESR